MKLNLNIIEIVINIGDNKFLETQDLIHHKQGTLI